MVSLPQNAVVQQALANLEPLVVIDFFMSETAELADVVLPGTVWLEDEGTTTNLEGRVIKINKAQEPAGESRPDWWILSELARRLGKGQLFPYEISEAIWQELRRATAGGVADYSGITWERIDKEDGVFWPCPSEDHPGSPRLFAERFHHPDGRARFHVIEYAPPAEEPSEEYPFRLTTGRVVYQYLSGNQTRRLGFLNAQAPEPWVEVHPQAAARLGIADGDQVRVRTPRAEMTLKAIVAPTLRPDTLFIPFHYGHKDAVNQLTNPVVEPEVKIPEYKASAAALERLDAPEPRSPGQAVQNETSDSAPDKFPYAAPTPSQTRSGR
jgi:assimilatory nitrate reductase catalytic subunit